MSPLSSISDPVRLGALGLGRAFALSAPGLAASPHVRLVAGADPRPGPRAAFAAAFGGTTHAGLAGLLAGDAVEAVYVATPHEMHRDHAVAALAAGRHVLVEKPLATTLADAEAIVEAARAAGRQVVVGPGHGHDGPVALAARLIRQGIVGRVGMIHALCATDYLYRPRRAAELDPAQGGVLLGQAVHQIDIVRRLAGAPARRVSARTGTWDKERPVEGAYGALIDFAGGAFASLVYSGYGGFDSDVWMEHVSELGRVKPPAPEGRLRRAPPGDEAAAQAARGFSGPAAGSGAVTHEHFGPVLVFGSRGDLRLTPGGVEVFDAEGRRFLPAPFRGPRAEVFRALHAAVRRNRPALMDARWGLASLEICLAMRESARSGAPVALHRQGETRT